MNVEILGQRYEIKEVGYDTDPVFAKENIDGYCDRFNKVIMMCDYGTHPDWKDEPDADKKAAHLHLLRHEIIHAFLAESGLYNQTYIPTGGWADNEEMVDWIAVQLPKIVKACKAVGALQEEKSAAGQQDMPTEEELLKRAQEYLVKNDDKEQIEIELPEWACDLVEEAYKEACIEAEKGLNIIKEEHNMEERKSINELIKEAHKTAKEHGWWNKPIEFGTLIALCHSELSEALEEYRNGKPVNECFTDMTEIDEKMEEKPTGIPIELADVCIRIFDLCGYYEIDLEEAIRKKMEYNKIRTYRHGGKKI